MRVAIGIDIGGTNIKGVLINESGEILYQSVVPTGDDATENWKVNVAGLVKSLEENHGKQVDCIGISSPGFANQHNSCISCMPGRLAGLEQFNWGSYFQAPTYVLNDAHAALIAESAFGAIRGYRNAVLLTLGTGVGGGMLINGELHQGLGQTAGHFGHMTINPHDDELSILGMPGTLEYAIGNYSVARRSAGRYSTTQQLVEAYSDNDPFATWLWLDSIRKLSLAIRSIVNAISPEVIVLAGGITKANDALFKPLNEFMKVYEFSQFPAHATIVAAHYSDWAGAVGAASFALSKHQRNLEITARELTDN